MLYICVPSYNEAPTVGVLLWRIRKVFQEYSREYEIIVYDDASTDGTRDALAPYKRVMQLTVIGSSRRVGYARAVEALLRSASDRTKYPRRDAVVMMQADFTDQPEHLPELVKRFEGGADIVVGEAVVGRAAPEPVRKLARLAKWMPALWPLRSAMSVPGVKDPFNGYRLMRISLIRDLLKARGDRPFADGPVWSSNIELLKAAAPLARRIESLPLQSRWDVRLRESRVRPWPDAVEIIKRGWASRKHQAPTAVTPTPPPAAANRTPTAAA